MSNVATQRVVTLVDMDCFYCQVEARLNPSLKGKPMAVVQYNQWKGGGIIAVNYEARDRGVTRYMRGDEAKEKCPEIILVSVPTIRGKADLSNYRDAGDEVAQIFSEFSDCVQRASIDEAYLDITKAVQEYIKNENEVITPMDLPNTFVVGYCNLENKSEDDRKKGLTEWLNIVERERTKDSADYKLCIGAKIVEKMRAEILRRTGFHCSAGVAHNKILAKLTAGLHKPRRQTILPQDSVLELYERLPVYKVRNLGGKLGKQVAEKLSINYMSELYRFSLGELQEKFDEKTSSWLYNIARGIDLEPVTSRLRPESVGCCKRFPGKNALITKSEVEHWLKELASEISERLIKDLEKNKRRAKLLTVSFSQEGVDKTRCGTLNSYEVTRIVNDALELLKKFNSAPPNEDLWAPPIKFLGLSASKFTEEVSSIEKYLKNCKKPENLNNPPSLPSCSKTCKYDEKKEENKKPDKQLINSFFKTEKPNRKTECDQINESSKQSFFLKFLNDKKEDDGPLEETTESTEDNAEGEEGETWISLSEVFPDLNEADAEVLESLPEPFKKKFKERINPSENYEATKKNSSPEKVKDDGRVRPVTDTCSECGKIILVSEFPVHMDYHAALKLYSEINKTTSQAPLGVVNKRRSNYSENLSKRKKKAAVTPTKKMKSLTSFFAPLHKE